MADRRRPQPAGTETKTAALTYQPTAYPTGRRPHRPSNYFLLRMPYPPFRSLPYLALAAGLLGACSSPQSPGSSAVVRPDPAAAPPAAPAPPKFPYGTKVDSLNGSPGHSFGQPLTAFAKLEPIRLEPGVPFRAYRAPAAGAGGWFSRHRREVPGQFYHFVDGQFFRFRAVGDAATLRTEANYLFGPGRVEGLQVFWEGERARAVYSEQVRGLGREGTLDVLSKPLEAALAAREKARLQADNAQ